jgi:L-amino acid N-acyltransferase YncA
MPERAFIIRPSADSDIAAIAAIYAHHVRHGVASFEETPPEPDEIARRRRAVTERGLPYLVAERDGRVIGYCHAGPFRPRSGYRYTIEDSIYIEPGEIGRGVGRALLSTLIDRCTHLGYRQMVAVIGGSDQWPSIRLHERLGFSRIGLLPAVGFKFGAWIDVVVMQRALGPGAATPPHDPPQGA